MRAGEGSVAPSQPSVLPPHRQRRLARTPVRFGLLPVRSPLLGESSLFLRVLRCFSSPRAPRANAVPGVAPGGLPHSDISGSPAASASPEHFAAWPRPSSAACAKASTVRPSSRICFRHHHFPLPPPTGRKPGSLLRLSSRPHGGSSSCQACARIHPPHVLGSGRDDQIRPSLVNVPASFKPLAASRKLSVVRLPGDRIRSAGSRRPPSPPLPGGAAGTRTPDLRRAKAALSQLSYGPSEAASYKPQASSSVVGSSCVHSPVTTSTNLAPCTPALHHPRA